MTDFEKAYKRTCRNEGGYANNPHDKGGETWKGVARNFWPNWPGWKIIDQCKDQYPGKFISHLATDQQLEALVHSFYKTQFWDISKLDEFVSQLLAENVFDASVNCGPSAGPRFLQHALNEVGSYGLLSDGVVGPKTLAAANDAITKFGETAVVNKYVDMREAYHRAIVQKDPSQGIFLNNWLSRCKSMRKAA